jgi:hypothetical protein
VNRRRKIGRESSEKKLRIGRWESVVVTMVATVVTVKKNGHFLLAQISGNRCDDTTCWVKGFIRLIRAPPLAYIEAK